MPFPAPGVVAPQLQVLHTLECPHAGPVDAVVGLEGLWGLREWARREGQVGRVEVNCRGLLRTNSERNHATPAPLPKPCHLFQPPAAQPPPPPREHAAWPHAPAPPPPRHLTAAPRCRRAPCGGEPPPQARRPPDTRKHTPEPVRDEKTRARKWGAAGSTKRAMEREPAPQ